jgi:hypothetical protein
MWAPKPVWTTCRRENPWPYWDSNSEPVIFQPVASRYTEDAIPSTHYSIQTLLFECIILEFESFLKKHRYGCGLSGAFHGYPLPSLLSSMDMHYPWPVPISSQFHGYALPVPCIHLFSVPRISTTRALYPSLISSTDIHYPCPVPISSQQTLLS